MKKDLTDIKIFFLVSRGRSGSTLLQSIFDAHPNTCAPIESKFVLHLRTKYLHRTNWSKSTIEEFIKDLYTNRKFRLFWKVTPDQLREKFNTYNISHFRDACKVAYLCHHSFFKKENISVIIDKNPLHSRLSEYLLDIFPDAKFIHLIRDPRAVVNSHIKSLMQKNVENLAYEWYLLNEKVESVKINNPDLFYTIKYEDFTSNPNHHLEKIMQFIGLPFYENLINANSTLKENAGSSVYLSLPHHKNITQPISTKKNDAWKKNLSKNEITLITLICKEQLIQYNYPFNTSLNASLWIRLKAFKGKWRSKLKNEALKTMFNLPFPIRAFIYNSVSLIKDKKYLAK